MKRKWKLFPNDLDKMFVLIFTRDLAFQNFFKIFKFKTPYEEPALKWDWLKDKKLFITFLTEWQSFRDTGLIFLYFVERLQIELNLNVFFLLLSPAKYIYTAVFRCCQ